MKSTTENHWPTLSHPASFTTLYSCTFTFLINIHLSILLQSYMASTYRILLASMTILQKRVTRIVCNAPPRANTKSLFLTLRIHVNTCINKLRVGLFMYKRYKRIVPVSYDGWFYKNSEIYDHQTRSSK